MLWFNHFNLFIEKKKKSLIHLFGLATFLEITTLLLHTIDREHIRFKVSAAKLKFVKIRCNASVTHCLIPVLLFCVNSRIRK